MKLFEVKIYQPAENGLFPHPRQIRLVNMWDMGETEKGRLLQVGESRGYFVHGRGWLFCGRCNCRAEIVREIDENRAMEPDRVIPY